MRNIITLLTDFGTADGYVAEMKALLLSQLHDATIVDISHSVPPHDVDHARVVLARYWRKFPVGTVHLVVVDPGVGSSRAALAVESDHRFLVGPDNGVLSAALEVEGARTYEIPVPPGASPTFHGRDVFTPAAAALSLGAPMSQIATPFASPVVTRTPLAAVDGERTVGEIIAIDRFGNAVTNIPGPADGATLEVAGHTMVVRTTYAEAGPGEALGLTASNGFIEIAVRDGRAAEALALRRGLPVIVRR